MPQIAIDDALAQKLSELAADRQVSIHELVVQAVDGLNGHHAPPCHDDHQPPHCACRLLNDDRDLLARMVEQTPSALLLTDAQGIIQYINPACAAVTGYDSEEVIGSSGTVFMCGDGPDAIKAEMWQTLEAGKTWTGICHSQRKNGEWYWEQNSIKGLTNSTGQATHYLSVKHDITERMHIVNQERDQRVLAEALRETAAALNSTLDFHAVLFKILDIVGRVVPHDAANIMLIEGDQIRMAYWRGYPEENRSFYKDLRFDLKMHNFDLMFRTRKPLVVGDTRTWHGWDIFDETSGVLSYAAAPIHSRGQVIGFLNLDSDKPHFFRPEHAERLSIFADQAAIAIENAQLYETLQNQAALLEQRVNQRTAELQQSKEQLQTIFDSSSDAILLVTAQGLIQQANLSFHRMFGVNTDLIGRPLWSLSHDESELRRLQSYFELPPERRGYQRMEMLASHTEGEPFHAEIALSPLPQPEAGIVCNLRDISAHKHIERDLRRALEKERELNELKSRFVSTVSHEFRTPLAMIMSSADMLRRYSDRMNDEQRDERLARMQLVIKDMTRLLEDLLTINRVDQNRINFNEQSIDLDAFARDAIHEVQEAYGSDHAIRFTLTGAPAFIQADPKLLRQIIINLLSNAVKYSTRDPNSPVDFHIKREGSQWLFEIRDYGIGIASEDQPLLFNAFHRGKNVADIPGTGLGLAIAQRAVELHGGALALDSVLDQGTTIVITLPAVATTQENP